ncbi:MAG: septum formation initiator family protein [Oscillospiraceae bacterium]|nr:septum formation initiator family protein [Oscillospiraceae bacterium]
MKKSSRQTPPPIQKQLKDQSYGRESNESDDILKKYEKSRGVPVGAILLVFAAVIVLVPFLLYLSATDTEIRESRARLEALQEEQIRMELENERLQRYLDDDEAFEEYLERQARDVMGYANPGERIYNIWQ